ncbi:N-acetylmuramic acid 6-phosphate etherase [Microbacterium sp. STN6]|uniref:N-acetylmuramic acid 6-phosphate etherase n=1 Tax=Microbacterium sp. STN6 TaxID=2995588 RepID=UPI002260B02E|nr:N-acetylmuramic acid 6-phosphate etherase [Microbacterium sp. STN6]MCX7523358.1 N-acetylmuramic acid 6-phosphate etherase [Microbacterium sp. STN6]
MGQSDDRAQLRSQLAGLSTESVNDELRDLDTLPTSQLVASMNAQDAEAPVAVARESQNIATAIDGISERLAHGGRLIYVGAGTPGRLGVLDASECPPTFGTDPSLVVGLIAGGDAALRTAIENAEDDGAAAIRQLSELRLSHADAVVGISASGRTPYVVAALGHAREVGAFTVGVACNRHSPVGEAAEVRIEVEVGPEFITGSTRLKAGTAQKLVLNMISTITMVRLGKTYGNTMVDLRATNEKLRARAEATVMRVAEVDAAPAARALAEADGSLKEAIMMLRTGLPYAEARAVLAAHGGYLRRAIEAAQRSGEA